MINGIVSLLFFLLELGLLLLVFKYIRPHALFSPIAALLGLLLMYQASEFLTCSGLFPQIMPRIGYLIITFLPPTGYYLTALVTKWKHKDYYLYYALGGLFGGYYLMTTSSVLLVECNPLYAVYHNVYSIYYGYYYFGVILLALLRLGYFITENKDTPEYRPTLLLLGGYLAFLTPMAILIYMDKNFTNAITSVLCKFAIFLAVGLTLLSKYLKDSSF